MNNLQRALEEQKQQTAPDVPQIPGLLGVPLNGQRRVEVSGRNAYVYVRLRSNQNEVIQAYNNQVAPAYNLPVLVERQGNKYVVIGVDTARYENNWTSQSPFLPRHGNTHSFDIESGGAGDIVWVQSRQIVPALVFPSGSAGGDSVIVHPYLLKNDDGTWKYVGNTGTTSFTPYLPTGSNAVMALVYLDSVSGNPYFLVNSGSVFSNTLTGTSQIVSYIPTLPSPATQIPLAAIRLITGTNQISWDNIYDVRQWLHTISTGSAGGISSVTVQDEGVSQGTATTFNFVGDGVQATISGSVARVNIPAGAINTGTLDARYLKLDTSNDPIYGQLSVSGSIYLVKAQEDFLPAIYAEGYISDNPIVDFEQYAPSASELTQPVMFLYRTNRTASLETTWSAPMLDFQEVRRSGTISGGVLRAMIDGTKRLELNPSSTGTLVNYIYDTDKSRPTGTIHTSFRVLGNEVTRIDVSGTVYSNNSPLIKEAPVDGQIYARKNAGWEPLKNGSSVLGSGISLTGTAGTYQEITGISLTFPEGGTYKIAADIRGALKGNAGSLWWIHAKLYNDTDAADVADSETLITLVGTSAVDFQNTAPINKIVTVTASKVIKLYAARNGAGSPSWTISEISSDSNGKTRMSYEKIG